MGSLVSTVRGMKWFTDEKRRRFFGLSVCLLFYFAWVLGEPVGYQAYGVPTNTGPVVIITIDGPINPATDDYLRTSIEKAIVKCSVVTPE